MKNVIKDIFLKVMFNISKILHEPHNDKVKKPVANLRDKKVIYYQHSKSKASYKSRISFENKSESH